MTHLRFSAAAFQLLLAGPAIGAVPGDFKSEPAGVGLGFLWTPPMGDGRHSVLGKRVHDPHAENRFEFDPLTFTAAWKF